MSEFFDTLLFLALPGSGKSEVRNYLTHKDPASFHMGPTVQLDDYPYVHLQLVVDEILLEIGQPRAFHDDDPGGQRNGPFKSAFELGALCELLCEDYAELLAGKAERPENPAARLLERFDHASEKAGAGAKFRDLDADVRARLEEKLMPHARTLFEEKADNCPSSLNGKTVVIEFARGGPKTDKMPLEAGYGYKDSLPHLGAEILERAAILYIWVTPEESRRKNVERVRPDGNASILFHGTPESVMDQEYGMCDMGWLLETSDEPGTIGIVRNEKVYHIPVERFDNRVDLTSFLRKDVEDWSADEIGAIHAPLMTSCTKLWGTYSARRG